MLPLLLKTPPSGVVWSVFLGILGAVAVVDSVHGYWMTRRRERRRIERRLADGLR